MAIELPEHGRKHALASLRRFCEEELEAELTDIQIMSLLNFMLKEIGPSVYNMGLASSEAFLRDRLADLEGACGEVEFSYWPKGSSVRRK
ncbi:MAG: DUF2164 domain-containing protein [Gemmatimonadota bacterium]